MQGVTPSTTRGEILHLTQGSLQVVEVVLRDDGELWLNVNGAKMALKGARHIIVDSVGDVPPK